MIIGILKTFEDDLISRFPETEYFFQLLYEQLNYMTETIKNIFILAKDLINSY